MWLLALALASSVDEPSVSRLVPGDALAVLAVDDLGRFADRARELPAVREFSREEWRASIEHVAAFASQLTGALPYAWTQDVVGLESVSRAYAALVPDDVRRCAVVFGLQGRNGAPPVFDAELLRDASTSVEGDVLVVSSSAAAAARAITVLREPSLALASSPRFRARSASWTIPTHGVWLWADPAGLEAMVADKRLDLGAFRALVAQRLGRAFAWTLEISRDTPPTIATTTWIELDRLPPPYAFDQELLRIVPRDALWMQTVHWDRETVLVSASEEMRRSRWLELLCELPLRAFDAGMMPHRIKALSAALTDDLARFAQREPAWTRLFERARPPLIVFAIADRLAVVPTTVVCVRIDDATDVLEELRDLNLIVSWETYSYSGIDIAHAPYGDVSFAIVDGWLVGSVDRGVPLFIQQVRGARPSIVDNPRFRECFDALPEDEATMLDLAFCDAPMLLAARENAVLGLVTILGRSLHPEFEAFALPSFDELPAVAPASVGIARRTSQGIRIDRRGFLGGELTGLDGAFGISGALAKFVEEQRRREPRAIHHALDAVCVRTTTFRSIHGRWPSLDELRRFDTFMSEVLVDDVGPRFSIDVIDASRCRVVSLGWDHAIGGVGLDADQERVLIADP
ncbi:MAG: hypothetical protein IPH13_03935 [Planctomycetes bacterium]|nr:hypothetical protein [Planctomycetota bacterium]